MILDYRKNPLGLSEMDYLYGRVLVDGIEIMLCFYVDTEAGLVKTYDVDGTHKAVYDPATQGVKVREVRGKVELFRKG